MKPWWRSLARYAYPYKGRLSLVMLLLLLGVAIDVVKPWPMKLLLDYVLKHQPLPQEAGWAARVFNGAASADLLGWLAGATFLLFLASRTIQIAHAYIMAGVGAQMSYDLGTDLLDHLQRVSPRFHVQHKTADLAHRVINNNSCVREEGNNCQWFHLTPNHS